MKHHPAMEVEEEVEEMMDEDVFLDETLLYDMDEEESSQLLRHIEESEALASGLAKWKRPALSPAYLSHSKNIGHSVCCHVHGFEPYFYISCPPGMGPDDISKFHQILEGRMREMNRNNKVPRLVCRIEMVQKRSIMYYQQQGSHPFLKIVVALPTMVASCRG